MRRFPKVLIFSVLAALAFLPQLGETCGPFFNPAVFVRPHGPDEPLSDFARGKIGVVLPQWYTAYRVVAYRYLESKPLSALEQQSLLENYDVGGRVEPPNWVGKAAEDWVSARSEYNQEPAPIGLTDKPTRDGFSSYPNCLAPAFITAVATLKDRAQRFGPASPELQEWIRGQDAVFSNCSRSANAPPELPATANPLLRADRAYQIAAAHFYAGPAEEGYEIGKGYDVVVEEFQAIAADQSSPWHTLAPYLAARALIRQASVAAGENQAYNPVFLAKAEVQLEAILKDPAQQSMHDAALSLIGLVRYYLHPQEREAELGKALAEGGTGAHFAQDLIDFTWLTNRSPQRAHDDLSDWLVGGGPNKDAIAEWRTTRSIPWLVAALWELKPRDAAYNEVMEAAGKVPPASDAYITVAYYRARLARQSGNMRLARQILQAALVQTKALTPSAVHLFQDEQMKLAPDWETFESRLWQKPIGYGGFGDDMGGIEPCEKPDCQPLFSPAAATLINTRIPADIFVRIALSSALPANLQNRMAPSAWARAALLDQSSLAPQVSGAAVKAEPALQPYLQQYAKAQTPEERQFAAAFAILHFPGLRPFVDGPLPRTTPFERIDNYRDNWWCQGAGSLDEENVFSNANYYSQGNPPPGTPATPFPALLDAGKRQRAAAEWQRLSSNGTAGRYLPRIVIEWAKKHPEDARVPEALHLAVRATRYGCDDGKPNPLSREAFTILHQNYPKSEWAAKTPYWFK